MALQAEVARLEDVIADRRELYNDQVFRYNTRIQQVPANLLAGLFGWEPRAVLRGGRGGAGAPGGRSSSPAEPGASLLRSDRESPSGSCATRPQAAQPLRGPPARPIGSKPEPSSRQAARSTLAPRTASAGRPGGTSWHASRSADRLLDTEVPMQFPFRKPSMPRESELLPGRPDPIVQPRRARRERPLAHAALPRRRSRSPTSRSAASGAPRRCSGRSRASG